MFVQGPNKTVSIAIFSSGHWSFGFDDRVDSAHFDRSVHCRIVQAQVSTVLVRHTSVGDLCGYLEEIVVPNVSVGIVDSSGGTCCGRHDFGSRCNRNFG